MQVRVCVGAYAEKPYNVPGLEMSVYSMEELCYCFRENAFLLDGSLCDERLADWVEKECGLPQVAEEIRNLIRSHAALTDFVTFLMDFVQLYDKDVAKEIADAVKKGAGLSDIEKRKKQIDNLLKKKKYPEAIRKYDELLAHMDDAKGDEETPVGSVHAAILNNKGVALTGMMEYAEAAGCFLAAYEQFGDRTYFDQYLAAKRLELKEEDYIIFVSELQGGMDASLKLEKTYDSLKKSYEETDRYKRLRAHIDMRRSGNRQLYYDECDRITKQLRTEYRSQSAENERVY